MQTTDRKLTSGLDVPETRNEQAAAGATGRLATTGVENHQLAHTEQGATRGDESAEAQTAIDAERTTEQGPASTLLVVDDDPAVLHLFVKIFQEGPVTVVTAASAEEGIKLVGTRRPDVVVLDVFLADQSGLQLFERFHACDAKMPVIFITASGTSDTAIEAMQLGAYDYLTKPLNVTQIKDVVARASELRRFMQVPVGLMSTPVGTPDDVLVGRCAAMQEVYKAIGRVASQNVTVLIRGESGTGKELVARAIYQHSQRKNKPFLAVNCAAIPEPLLESELFGHEKGAYTGADAKRIGKFEQCSGGTLFLDEIGDMTPLVQSKVLRLLQEQRFERVGGNETIKTDVRIIAATNCNLEQMVADGQFRADLYYRLNGFTIELPPLRERTDDIVPLVEHLLMRFNTELGKQVHTIAPEAFEVLLGHHWPGNVRELQSVLKQALLHATGSILMPDFLPEHVRNRGRSTTSAAAREGHAFDGWEAFVAHRLQANSENLYAEALNLMEKFLITRVLRHTGGNQSHAAKLLGITRGCLRNKVRTLGISIDQVVSLDYEPGDEDETSALAMTP